MRSVICLLLLPTLAFAQRKIHVGTLLGSRLNDGAGFDDGAGPEWLPDIVAGGVPGRAADANYLGSALARVLGHKGSSHRQP